MADPSAHPCVLVVADRERVGELVAALSELPQVEVLVSSGGDDTIDLFEARRPAVVVLTASLQIGDTKSLIVRLRKMVPRAEVAIVVIGDDTGPIRTALDALDLAPDRFVTRPLSPKALRFAVTGGIDTVRTVRGAPPPVPPLRPVAMGAVPGRSQPEPAAIPVLPPVPPPVPPLIPPGSPSSSGNAGPPVAVGVPVALAPAGAPAAVTRAALRARWEALADSMLGAADYVDPDEPDEPAPLPPPMVIQPRRHQADTPSDAVAPPETWKPGTTDELTPVREPTPIVSEPAPASARTGFRGGRVGGAAQTPTDELWSDLMPPAAPVDRGSRDEVGGPDAPDAPPSEPPTMAEPRDLARELRARMSMMAQRLFHEGNAPAVAPVDHAPPHDPQTDPHTDPHTEIDLASLGEEPPLGGGGTEIGAHPAPRDEVREAVALPGSWDTQVRERGLPDRGAMVRGSSDAAMLLAKMFAQGATGRIGFRRDDVEIIVYFDHGRPVFASSNEPRDRMGDLLLREGKITTSQYERCQAVVAASGRRMGEILVDLGYLKRRELLPAVRRHVEDIVYSLFGWERGTYYVVFDPQPSTERIRLSRHPAALILEGIRRKLDRTSLERLLGPPSTVVEVHDRERLGGIVNMGDLTLEERAALAAFDGQADLARVARIAGVDLADVLPLAWGLCVLGLATARGADTEVPGETTALVGETDLAIDRERVQARWQLVIDADYFALLGVRRDATGFEIRRAYQSARRDFAADCFPGDLRRELARELDDIAHVLDEAFRVLRDDRLRQTYLANLIDR